MIGTSGTSPLGPHLRHYALFNETPEEMREIHARLVAGLENGTLNPVIGNEFPWPTPRKHMSR
jgi:hypothetical protein